MKRGIANRLYMSSSVLLRMATGLLVLLVLARGLGPVRFGSVSTIFAYSGLGSLLTDFGFSLKTLRDIAATPARGGAILSRMHQIKTLLTVFAAVLGAVVLIFLPLAADLRLAGAAFASGILVGAIGDLAMVAFRATGRFGQEAGIVAWTSAVHGLLVLPPALLHVPLWVVGAAFLASRCGYAAICVTSARRLFASQPSAPFDLADIGRAIGGSLSWAADGWLTFLNSQIDGLLLVPLLGLAAAGFYQSGTRFVQAALAVAAVLSNVHIPAVAAGGRGRMSPQEGLMVLEFVGLGAVWAVIFVLGGPLVTRFLLGPAYLPLNQLWPGFAAFVFARYAAAGFGAALAAMARPAPRVVAQLGGLGVVVAGFVFLLPAAGLVAAPWIMAAGSATSLVLFMIARIGYMLNAKEPEPAASH